ncbi:putative oxidoreductase [Gimesia maris]|uniref:NAD(P)/FAD-dependent oxidoreductase n=1 Tax=Gimesia maris TaxID=122 RepID=UPI00118ABD3F|nr:FAD-dependent oxidoreductase [Gimesia maris]QDU15474.1 putative oxidoreductase [Gimesia maris]
MQHFDVVILGAGFGGSLTALLLDRIGLSVALIDRGKHPRFSIGESSTPAAGYLLQSLSQKYDLPQFQPFCKYGTWQQACPDIACGVKRGFSYFSHQPDLRFQTDTAHSSELLVTANLSETLADTHWYRADVDEFFAKQVQNSNVLYLDQTEILLQRTDGWQISGSRNGEEVSLQAAFLIDASGAAGLVPRALGIRPQTEFATRSRAIYGHFRDVKLWDEVLEQNQVDRSDYPFACDLAALHHVLQEGWMWQLRFNNGITSAGLVLDERQAGMDWRQMLARYPAIEAQFAEASVVGPETGLVTTGRLQRGWTQCAGNDWALLPHTAGFIDPLHSTGIAQTLCGIERLVSVLEQHWKTDSRGDQLADYSKSLQIERSLIDGLVACCYRSRFDFNLFTASTLFYFAAATSFEHQRSQEQKQPLFLCADDSEFVRTVDRWLQLVSDWEQQPRFAKAEIRQAVEQAERMLAPWNRVGLFQPAVPNMYYYTAAPELEPR